jgi:hypothetical protein
MSTNNLYVVWKGIKSGPYSKGDLEKEFTSGRLGLLRTVIENNTQITAHEFVGSIETQKREEQLAAQLKLKEEEAQQLSTRMEEQAENHKRLLKDAFDQGLGKDIAPPIATVKPWETAQPFIPESETPTNANEITASKSEDHNLLIASGYICIVLTLLSGFYFREGFSAIGFVIGLVLLRKKITANGIVVMLLSIAFFALGRLLTDFVHDYLIQNYPN